MIIRKTRTTIVLWSLTLMVVAAGIALADAATLDIKTKEGIGPYLVDAKGMTLYLFKNDSPGKSACAGPCVERWPAFYLEKVVVPAGIDIKDIGVITRDDGKKQTTYKSMPLYYFSGDKKPGDSEGQGIKDVWYVAKP